METARTKSVIKQMKWSENGAKQAEIIQKIFQYLFGSKMPGVRVSPLGPNNDNPNYIIQVGNVFGFIISVENIF